MLKILQAKLQQYVNGEIPDVQASLRKGKGTRDQIGNICWGETACGKQTILTVMGGGAWWAAVHGVTKSQTRLSDFTFTFHFHALE